MFEIIASTWSWTTWLGLALLGALLALDETAFAQTWFSQPLPAGLLAGIVCGDVIAGAAIGLTLQLVVLANLPVGQGIVCDPADVTVAAVGAASLRGAPLDVPAAVGVGGAAPLLGWLLVGCAFASLAGHAVVQLERRAHFRWMLGGHRTLRDGELGRIDRLQLRCLATTAVRGAVWTLFWLFAFACVWLPQLAALPGTVTRGLGWLPASTAGLAVGVVIERHQLRRVWIWLLLGLAAGFVIVNLGRR
jgi:mannose/fructose/N-acetylgalactosamine-specific phosphotransferase system component IIC